MKGCSKCVTVLLFATYWTMNPTLSRTQTQPQTEARTTARLQQDPAVPQPQNSSEIATDPAAGGASASAIAAPAYKPRSLAPGTTLLAEFSNSLNARKLKPGAMIKAILDQDLIVGGKVVAKNESKLVGHVTEVKAHSQENPESRLGILFDKILLKHHQELDFEAVVQALAPPALRRSRVDEPDQMMPVSMGGRGSGSSWNTGGPTSSSPTLPSPVTSPEQVVVVGSTTPGNISTVQAAVVKNKPMTGGRGVHGVYGLKGLKLSPSDDDSHPGPVIVSTISDVKLASGTQIVLLVVSR